MQSVSSRFWTRVAVFISYDDNDYTTGDLNKVPARNSRNLIIDKLLVPTDAEPTYTRAQPINI